MTKQTLAASINDFLSASTRRQLSVNTLRLYNIVLSEMEVNITGKDLREDVHRHINSLTGKPGTIQLKITVIKRFFNWMTKNDLCKKNPTDGIESIKVNNGRTRFLTIDEISTLLEACPPTLKTIVSIAIMTGLRRSAVLGLKHAEIDMANLRITVTSKGSVHRIPITDDLRQVLVTYWTNMEQYHPVYMFPNKKGTGPLDANALIEFRKICRGLGFNDVSLHTLRHTFASHLLKATGNIYLVQKALGHASISTTQRYAHLIDDDLRAGMNSVQFKS